MTTSLIRSAVAVTGNRAGVLAQGYAKETAKGMKFIIDDLALFKRWQRSQYFNFRC